MMKRTVIGFILLSAVLFTGLLAAQEVKGPKITTTELQYDFGKVPEGTDAIHIFKIRNAGTAPLVIQRIQSS